MKNIKRTELLVILSFTSALIFFYATALGDMNPDRSVGGRYMITSFVFVSFVYGFVIQNIYSSKYFNNLKLHNLPKILIIILLIIFFIFALYQIQNIYEWSKSETKFKNPYEVSQRYPLKMEGLNSDSIILNTAGNWVVDYGLTPFHPFLGYMLKSDMEYPQKPIQLLKEIINEGYDVYTFKESSHRDEKKYFSYLINNHGFILEDYSKTFCKLSLTVNLNQTSALQCLKN